jgi:hypothetical protein
MCARGATREVDYGGERFFDIVGKFIVGHLLDNQIALNKVTDALEDALYCSIARSRNFRPSAAVAASEKGVGAAVVLNVGDQLRKFGVVQCCP